jgi:tetratricopeptide (TPR) repeat protein
MMGELMLKRFGQPAQAVIHYKRAFELAPWEAGYAIRAAWASRAAGEPLPTASEAAAIGEALRERPLPPTTLIALQNLSDCVLTGDSACHDLLPALLGWLAAAQANPRLNAVGRDQVWMNYGQLCLETDRFEQGLAWVQSAYRHSPRPLYRLMEANFLMLQGHLDAATAVLTAVGQRPDLASDDSGHLAVLQEAIANRRAGNVPPDGRPR